MVAQGQGAADMALLDLGNAALSDCASVFSDTVDWLAFLSERGFAADDRERAIALRQSLEAVAKRYEKSAKSAEPDQHGGEPAAPGNDKPA